MTISFHSVLILLGENLCDYFWDLKGGILQILRDVQEHKKLSWTRFICFFTARRTLIECSDEILTRIQFSLQNGCIYTKQPLGPVYMEEGDPR